MLQKVLMVCSGNICRSPMAEAIFDHLVKNKNLSSDWYVEESAGIEGYHSGEKPEQRALNVLNDHNIKYSGTARQIREQDFYEFDFIFGMDADNVNYIKKKAPKDKKAQIYLLGSFGLEEHQQIIEDPYYMIKR